MSSRGCMRTRLHLLAAFALVCAAAPAIAHDYDRNSNESDCANKQGAEQIAAYTAWMQAGDLNEAEAAAAFEIRGSAYRSEERRVGKEGRCRRWLDACREE